MKKIRHIAKALALIMTLVLLAQSGQMVSAAESFHTESESVLKSEQAAVADASDEDSDSTERGGENTSESSKSTEDAAAKPEETQSEDGKAKEGSETDTNEAANGSSEIPTPRATEDSTAGQVIEDLVSENPKTEQNNTGTPSSEKTGAAPDGIDNELNKSPIIGNCDSDDVALTVSAPIESFPATAAFSITQMTADYVADFKEKNGLSFDKAAAFDISCLSQEGDHLQPVAGHKVKVEFCVDANNTLAPEKGAQSTFKVWQISASGTKTLMKEERSTSFEGAMNIEFFAEELSTFMITETAVPREKVGNLEGEQGPDLSETPESVTTQTNSSLSIYWTDGQTGTYHGQSVSPQISDNGNKIELYYTSPAEVKGKLVFHYDEAITYEPGSIQIEIPLKLFKDRSGNFTGLNVSVAPPEAPATSDKYSFNYTIDTAHNMLVFTNFETIKQTGSFETDFAYKIKGSQYYGVYDIRSGEEFPLEAKATIKTGSVSESLQTDPITADIVTGVEITNCKKEEENKFVKWQSEWGTQPENITDEEYVYYVFETRGTVYSYYMPYQWSFSETPSEGAIPIAWKGTGIFNKNAQNKRVNQEWTSFQDESYQTDWSEFRTLGAGYGDPAVFFVVAYPKADLPDGTQLKNTATFHLIGKDDTEEQTKDGTLTFTYENKGFQYEGDKYSVGKSKSFDTQTLSLALLKQGLSASLQHCGLRAEIQGYSLTQDANGEYGKRFYTAELIDDQIYLEGERLEAGDYYISGVENTYNQTIKLKFDENRGTWVKENTNVVEDPDQFQLYAWSDSSGSWKEYPMKVPGSGDEYETVAFQEGDITKIKVVKRSKEYASNIRVYLDIVLNPTEHVKTLIADKENVTLYNVGTLLVKDDLGKLANTQAAYKNVPTELVPDVTAADQKYGLENGAIPQHANCKWDGNYAPKTQELYKHAGDPVADYNNERCTVQYSLSERFNCGLVGASLDEYKALMNGGIKKTVFYDLLPEGMYINEDSICAAYRLDSSYTKPHDPEAAIPKEDVTVQIVQNWRESGRMMLIAAVNMTGNPPRQVNPYVYLTFQAYYPFDSIVDYGRITTNCAAAYQDEVYFDKAYADDLTKGRGGYDGTYSGWSTSNKLGDRETLLTYFSDLDGDGNNNPESFASTVYGTARSEFAVLTAADSGFSKSVKSENDVSYSKETTEKAEGNYTYRLRYSTASETEAKDLVFFDSLEFPDPDFGNVAYWRGTLQSVNISYAEKKGIAPVVYYSTKEGCNPNYNSNDRILTDEKTWSTVKPEDSSTITAIAVDLTKKSDGSDYVMSGGETVLVYLEMKAPEHVLPYLDPIVYAYNNSAAQSSVKNVHEGSFSTPKVLLSKPTKVSLEYEENTLCIKKTVTGPDGEKDKEFTYHISFHNLKPLTEYVFAGNGTLIENHVTKSFVSDKGGAADVNIKLTDGQSLCVVLPKNAAYMITEEPNNHVASYSIRKADDKIILKSFKGSKSEVSCSTGEQKLSESQEVTFVNDRFIIPVEKKWIGPAADSVTVRLMNGNTEAANQVLNAGNNWQYTFKDLDKYDAAGNEIHYTVKEDALDGYISSTAGDMENGFTITNYNAEKISIPVTKKWVGKDAEKAEVELKDESGNVVASAVLTKENGWKTTFRDLPKYDRKDGHAIRYSLSEKTIAGYNSVITGSAENGFTVTNTITGKISVGVTKKWIGPAKDSVTVRLQNRDKEIESAVLNAANNWQHTFSDLNQYDENGQEISYQITEDAISGYDTSVIEDTPDDFTVTNTNLATTSVAVEKKWVGAAKGQVTVTLLADGVKKKSAILTADKDWKTVFTNLPKYDSVDGHEFSYMVSESPVDGYSSVISGTARDGYTITNTIEGKISIPVTKVWSGGTESKAVVHLFADGNEISSQELNSGCQWQHTFENLDKYKDGKEISYTLTEDDIPGYSSVITFSTDRGFTVTNTKNSSGHHDGGGGGDNGGGTGAVGLYKVDAQTGTYLAGAQFALYRSDGTCIGNYTTDRSGYLKVQNLPYGSYYFVETKAPENYVLDPNYVRFTLDKAHSTGNAYPWNIKVSNVKSGVKTITVGGTKTWEDNNNAGGTRPSVITLHLLANGTEIAAVLTSADFNWTYSFGTQPLYDADGNAISYSVTEDAVPGYSFSQDAPVTADGKTVINVKNILIPPAIKDSNRSMPEKSGTEVSRSVATGDNSRMMLYLLLMIGSLIVLATDLVFLRRHKKAEK